MLIKHIIMRRPAFGNGDDNDDDNDDDDDGIDY